MAKIWLDHSDGRYFTRPLTDEKAAEHEAKGFDVVHLEDHVWEAYLRHCERDATWQVLWRSISNEQFMRRREKELMPLEDAAREIDRLKDELARAQRMASYFEDEWSRLTREQRRDPDHLNDNRYTCVYPQPGCDVLMLLPEWRHRALEILNKYSRAHAAEGLKAQGCCCGHQHRPLDAEAKAKLSDAGFLVEDDSETP